jgi:hypothetical protein
MLMDCLEDIIINILSVVTIWVVILIEDGSILGEEGNDEVVDVNCFERVKKHDRHSLVDRVNEIAASANTNPVTLHSLSER